MRKVTFDEYKRIVLDIFRRIDAICRKENIEYCLFYGALIGAVRHGGFIPWDDDIDLLMVRKEYDRLRDYIVTHPEYNLNFIDISTNPKTIYPFAKVCDVRTVDSDRDFIDVEGYGAFVDIFPYDYLPEDKKEREKLMRRGKRLNRLTSISARKMPAARNISLKKRIRGFAAFGISQILRPSSFVKKIDALGRKSNETRTRLIGTVRNPKNVFPVDWIFPSGKVMFEGYEFSCPRDIDRCLTKRYGDYMTLPPESERKSHAITCWIKDGYEDLLTGLS